MPITNEQLIAATANLFRQEAATTAELAKRLAASERRAEIIETVAKAAAPGRTITNLLKATKTGATGSIDGDGSALDAARTLQVAHRAAMISSDAVAKGHFDPAAAVRAQHDERARVIAKSMELAKANGTPAPSVQEVDAAIAKARSVGPRFAVSIREQSRAAIAAERAEAGQ